MQQIEIWSYTALYMSNGNDQNQWEQLEPLVPGISKYYANKEYQQAQVERLDKMSEVYGKALNNIVLLVGTGSFVLSVALITGLTENGRALDYHWVLIASWGLLLLSIISSGFRHIINLYRAGRAYDLLDEWGAGGFEGDHKLDTDKNMATLGFWAEKLSWIAFGLMVFGVVALFVFGAANVLVMSTSESQPNTEIKSVEAKIDALSSELRSSGIIK
jgi:hypothetical protein